MHACLWGKSLNKLEKLISWILILLNLQYYNAVYSVTITANLYIVYHGKQTLELLFSGNLSAFT